MSQNRYRQEARDPARAGHSRDAAGGAARAGQRARRRHRGRGRGLAADVQQLLLQQIRGDLRSRDGPGALQTGAALRKRPEAEPLWDAITHAVLQQYAAADQAPEKDWITGVRLVVSSPVLQGEYLKSNYVMQHVLAEAIAERTGTDAGSDMLPGSSLAPSPPLRRLPWSAGFSPTRPPRWRR
jgi:hypothetical protein